MAAAVSSYFSNKYQETGRAAGGHQRKSQKTFSLLNMIDSLVRWLNLFFCSLWILLCFFCITLCESFPSGVSLDCSIHRCWGVSCPLNGVFHVGHREGSAGEGECGHTVSYRQCCARTFIHWISLPFYPTCMNRLPVPLPRSPPPHPPHSLEAVRHKAVNHWIQAAIQAAQGNCDVIGEYMPHPLP